MGEALVRGGVEYLSDILVGIAFTYPFYGNIPFLRALYPFSRLCFFGPEDDAASGVTGVEIERGLHLYNIFARMFEVQSARGYLLFHDDFILNFWNLDGFDKSKVWHQPFRTAPMSEWYWWGSEWGRVPYLAAQAEFPERFRAKNPENPVYGFSDILYIPQACAADASAMFAVFAKHGVYLELAIPHVAEVLSRACGEEILRTEAHLFYERGVKFWPRYYNHQLDGLHPVKLSSRLNRLILRVLRRDFMESVSR